VRKRLLVIADPGCPASTRIRVTQFESYFQYRGVALQTFEWPAKGPGRPAALAALLECVAQADAVVFQRYLPPPAILRRIRRSARRLVYDFDDAIIYSESTHGKPRLKLRRLWRFRQMMRFCDAVSGGNEYLATIARRYGASDVNVLPTTIDLGEFERQPVGAESSAANRSADPAIGWIGLPSTLPYFEGLRRPLERLSEAVPRLKIRVISGQRPDLGRVPVEFIQWTAEAEAQEISRLRVGLAPLLDDPWTRGKCARRLTQYMAAGIPAVASPVGAQAEVTAYGAALPANTDDEWVQAVRRILDDANVAAQLATRGGQMVRERFAAQVWAAPLHNIWCGSV
jgi:glycosyltransferase involved in cell wall biosynthesis